MMTNGSFKILLINLSDSTERLERCRDQLSRHGLDFERIEGVDGRKLDKTSLEDFHPSWASGYFMRLTPAEIGCYLSHVKAVNRILELGLERALILEDDFVLCENFSSRLHALLKETADSDFDQIRLEGENTRFLVERTLSSGDQIVRYKHPLTRAMAILWTHQGARKFLDVAHPIRRPVDVQFKHWWEGDLHIAYAKPQLVAEHRISSSLSTIGRRKVRGMLGQVRRIAYCLHFSMEGHLRLILSVGMAKASRLLFGPLEERQRRRLSLPS